MEPLPEINLNLNTAKDTAKKTAKQATSSLKAAGSLVAKKAERTKLVTVTLPLAYAELGKALFKDGSRREEFTDLFQSVENLLAERKRIAEEGNARPAGTTVTEKAKKVAVDAADMARTKAIDLQAFQAFAKLGEAVFRQDRSSAGSSALVEPITKAIARRDQLDRDVGAINASAKGRWITPKRIAVGFAILFGLAVLGNLMDTENRTGGSESGGGRANGTGGTTKQRGAGAAKRATGSNAYEKALRNAQGSDFVLINDMQAILAEYGTTLGRANYQTNHASLWIKSGDEDDVVLLIADVEPTAVDHAIFKNDYALRSGLKGFSWEMGNLVIKGLAKAVGDPLLYGRGPNGEKYLKTEQNGATTFHAVVFVGAEPCEIEWLAKNRHFPDLSASLTTITAGGQVFMAGDGAEADMRPSTIKAIRRLLSGGRK